MEEGEGGDGAGGGEGGGGSVWGGGVGEGGGEGETFFSELVLELGVE